MKFLSIFCLVLPLVLPSETPKIEETLEATIQRVIQESKNDTLVVSGKDGTPENIETPKYIREFGSNLSKFIKAETNIDSLISSIDKEINEETRKNLQKLMLELAKEEIELKQEEKEEATRVVSVSSKKMTPAEITEEAKKQIENIKATDFISRLVSKATEGDDRLINVYFSYTLRMLEDVMVNTCKTLSVDNVKKLARCKTIIEDVVRGSAPFYKTGWFISIMTLFSIMVVGVGVFVFLVIKRGTSGTTTVIK